MRAGSLSTDREVGAEIDLLLNYRFNRHLMGYLGYSHFFVGDFVEEATPWADRNIDFFCVALQDTF